MTTQQAMARHGVHPPTWRRIARILVLVALLPVAIPASFALYINFIPAHSASVHLAEIDATVSLAFYWVWDERGDNSGRYLTVRSPKGSVTHQMWGFDWAHFPRTRIYLTGDQAISVHVTGECRAFVSPALLVAYDSPWATSDTWRYLGAFDLVSAPERGPGAWQMRFIPASERPQ